MQKFIDFIQQQEPVQLTEAEGMVTLDEVFKPGMRDMLIGKVPVHHEYLDPDFKGYKRVSGKSGDVDGIYRLRFVVSNMAPPIDAVVGVKGGNLDPTKLMFPKGFFDQVAQYGFTSRGDKLNLAMDAYSAISAIIQNELGKGGGIDLVQLRRGGYNSKYGAPSKGSIPGLGADTPENLARRDRQKWAAQFK